MRFSSDEQFFQQESKQQQKHQKNNQVQSNNVEKKKQKKETMLSKFLDHIDEQMMEKMNTYEKQKRSFFERRTYVPQKITLYEDILLIIVFKQNQPKIMSDPKHIKTLCLDLESRTKRKECTIKERIQKKLCKLRKEEILEHIASGKDISFNLKKEVSSNSKIQSTKNLQNDDVDTPVKKQTQQDNQIEQEKDVVKTQSNQNVAIDRKNPEQEIYEEDQTAKDKVTKEQNQKQIVSTAVQEKINPQKIIFIINKNKLNEKLPKIFNIELIEQQVLRLKEERKKVAEKEQLIKMLKCQLEVIENFKKSNQKINPQIKRLIQEAERISKILGLVENKKFQDVNENKQEKYMKIQETTDRMDSNDKQNAHISEFKMDEQNSEEEKKLSYSLCQNEEYIKLYKSDPQTFQPLLWTEQEDQLIASLLNDFDSMQGLFKLLIKYKGPEMFVERCIFLKKNIKNSKFYDALLVHQPLNINRLNTMNLEESKEEKVEEANQNMVIQMENQQIEQLLA